VLLAGGVRAETLNVFWRSRYCPSVLRIRLYE